MSLHKSLRTKNELQRSRNVLTRKERLKAMREKGTWKDGDPVFGLPKLRVAFKFKKRAKKVKEETPEGEGEAAAPAAEEGKK
jgi:small basic protein (TIGR04137 family)